MNSTANASLYTEANSLAQRAQALRIRLAGNVAREYMGDTGPVPIALRVGAANSGSRSTAYGPTPTHRRSLEIATEEFQEVGRALDRLIDTEFRELRNKLDAAGVPWTPGRGVPVAD
jgi:hypothetical protein